MRKTGEAALYLIGSRLDHDHCLGSADVGVLLSVLPEDAVKAAVPGYHPGSTEIYVTFQGSLQIEWLTEQRQVDSATVNANELHILQPGVCHRVRRDPKGRKWSRSSSGTACRTMRKL